MVVKVNEKLNSLLKEIFFVRMTLYSAFQKMISSLTTEFGFDEAEAMARIVFEDVFSILPSAIVLDGEKEFLQEEKLNEIISRLLKHEPVQYVTGKAYFYGEMFEVNSSVLIPRPETEELVQWIVEASPASVSLSKGEGFNTDSFKILDIGTGSGCIAIALKKNISADVFAIDVSANALEVARRNSEKLSAEIHFALSDILELKNPFGEIQFDIIVSNPPYISEDEKNSLDKNVLAYEPHEALFAKGNDALIFYKAIIEFSKKYLKPNGKLFFEINQLHGNEVKKILEENNFHSVELKNDINKNPRMVSANK